MYIDICVKKFYCLLLDYVNEEGKKLNVVFSNSFLVLIIITRNSFMSSLDETFPQLSSQKTESQVNSQH